MVHQRRFILSEGASKTLPLQLQSMQIDNEWRHVVHGSIDEAAALKSFTIRMRICMGVTMFFTVFTLPIMAVGSFGTIIIVLMVFLDISLFCTLLAMYAGFRKREHTFLANVQQR